MATIASLVIEIGANASGVRRELDRANDTLKSFANNAQKSFSTALSGFAGGKIDGSQAAAHIAGSLKQQLDNKLSGVREDLFKGLLNPAQAKKAAQEAGTAYNAGLLQSISSLRASGVVPQEVLNGMVNQLQETGLKGGKELAGAMISSFGEGMKAFGTTLTQYVTAPLIGAGAESAKFAGEAEIAGKRLGIVWGPMAGQVNAALNELHKHVPATTTELQNMTAITSEILLPLGIIPKKAAEMTLSFVSLSKSLSILNNVSPDRAMNALQSALVGLSRPLRLLGIDVDDASVKIAAQRLHLIKHGETMTEVIKAQARYAVVMERSGLVVDAATTLQETFLVQLKFLIRDVKEAAIAIGQQLNPALLPIIKTLRDLTNSFKSLSPHTQKLIVEIALIAASIGPLLVAGGSLLIFIGFAVTALTTLGVSGFAALALTIGPVVVAILGVAAAVAFMVGAFDSANASLGKFQQQASGLDKTQVHRAINSNLQEQIKLIEQRDKLLKQPQTETHSELVGAGESRQTIQTTVPSAAANQVAAINKVLHERDNIALALGGRMKVLNAEDAKDLENTRRWNEQIKAFHDAMAKVDTSKTALKEARDAATDLVDQLALFRDLHLDITKPLANVQKAYDEILNSVGGIDHIQELSLDKLKIALQLQRAISAATEERDKAPTVAARTALSELQDRRAEVIQSAGQVPIESLRTAYDAARKSLESLEQTNRALGDKAPAAGLREATRIRNELGNSFEQFAAGVEVALDKGLAEITASVTTAKQAGINKFFAGLTDLHNTNIERTSALKSGFGVGASSAADIGAGALDLLKDAALGVAEGFTPLGLLARFIGKALEPLAPALNAFLLPLDIVAKVVGTALIPVLRTLFPIIKFAAIAMTYLSQVMYLVTSFILRAVGSLVRGLGRLINKLPGSPGDPLVRAGQALLDLADGYTESAKEMARARKEISDLSFDDAMTAVNGLAKAANDASQNIPQIFKLARAVFDAANPINKPITPASIPIPTGSPTGGGIPTSGNPGNNGGGVPPSQDTYNIQISGANKSAKQLFQEITAEAERQNLLLTGSTQL